MSCDECCDLPILEDAVQDALESMPFCGAVVSLWNDDNYVENETTVRLSSVSSNLSEFTREKCNQEVQTLLQFDVRDDCLRTSRIGAAKIKKFFHGLSGQIGNNLECGCPVYVIDAAFAGQRDLVDSGDRSRIVSLDILFRHKL